jgi:hypothetical protein
MLYAWRMVCCCGLPVGRGVGDHAPSIRLGDLHFSIRLSVESHHWNLRTSTIDSIVGVRSRNIVHSRSLMRFPTNDRKLWDLRVFALSANGI